MMCDELYRQLTDYSDGVLAPNACAEVERHLAECLLCAGVSRDLADLSRLCREEAPLRMPDDLRQRLQGLIAG